MPGNEAEDRVHNFFPQEDLSSGHHHPQAADGSWQELGNNLWPGSQGRLGLPTSNSKGYNLQQSDTEREQNSPPFQVADGLNYGQPTLGSVLATSHSQSQLSKSNGYMHGREILQTRQNEANFLGVDAESDRYTMTLGGLSVYASQGRNGLENNVGSDRSESLESRVRFLGVQQQMSGQQIGMLQSLPQQLSGFNDIDLLQQEVMSRKMQELQRQHLEARHNNSPGPNPSIINGTPISPITAASNSACPAEPSAGNKSWLHHATQAAQRSPNERFPTEQGQPLSFMGLVSQQVDQSIYGVPISDTRGNPSHYPHVSVENHPMQQMAVNSNSSLGDQYRGPTNQVYVQEGSLSSRQGFQEENLFGQRPGQGLARGRMYSGNSELVNSPLQRDSPVQEFTGPSETMEGKTVLRISSSENVALDPTEQKILFGDGNIWDSFGNSANIGDVGGSWSAFMQSAVAETSSNDVGLKEELSGPSIHNTEIAVVPLSNDVNNNKSFQGVSEFQQSAPNYPYEHGDRLQMDSAHRSFRKSSEEGSKWLSRGPLQKPQDEGTQIYQNTTCSSGAIESAKSVPRSWAAQQNIPAHISDQPYGKPNGHDDVETSLSGGNEVSRFYGNESRFQQSGSNDQKRMLHGEMSQRGVHMWKMVPGPQSTGGLEQVSVMGSTQVNREEARMNTRFRRADSGTARASEGTSSNSNNLNFWKRAENPNTSKGNEHYLNKGSLVLEPSMNSSGNEVIDMRETENSERKENSSDSHHSNISQRVIAGSSNDKVWLDESDNQNLLGQKKKVPGQGGQNVSGTPKSQYHPMGNLNEDVESSFGRKSVSNNQSQRYLGQSKVFGQFPKTSREIEKGRMFSVQQNKKGADDLPSRETFTGFARNTSQLSQNVPELFYTMDQSKENSNSDGSIGPRQQSQSPSSHDFGLQLGFPSQLLPTQNHALSSHGSSQLAGSLSFVQDTYERREKDNTSQAEPSSSFYETSGEFYRNKTSGMGPNSNDAPQYSMPGNLNSASTSGFPFLRGQLQGQQVISAVDGHDPNSSQNRINQKDGIFASGAPSQFTEAIATREKVATQKLPTQQNLFGGQPHKFPPGIFRPSQLNNNVVSTLGEGQQAKGSHHQLGSSADLAPMPSVSQGRESVHKNQSDASPSNSASTERDYEAFGRSLKPNNLRHPNYSLLNQMQAMKSTEIDPSNRGLKRFKGAESSVGSEMRPSSEQRVMVGDPRILSFSGSTGAIDNNSSPLPANVLTQDVRAPTRMDSDNYPCSSTTSLRVEHSQISPQMAPSWFEHYGTFKNGQMLSRYNAHQHSSFKTIEQRLPLGKSSDTLCASNVVEQANPATDYIQSGNMWQRSSTTPVTVENLPSTQLMIHDVTDKGLAVSRLMKRKSATPLTSCHKEMTQGCQSLLTTSKAEVEWAKATNRLIDKLEDEAETFEDRPPGFRSRRRLILTTQLMQQLFRPPAAGILSADAYSNYEAVACMGARLTLGDAYGLMHCSKSDSWAPLDSINSLIDKHKTTESERNGDQRLSDVMEHFIGRAKKLESDFMRLDKRASLVDLRTESQDLEKVSMINRFARFHGRGHADLAPTGPQRYVNALPIPRVLPERVQCLSL